MRRTKETVTVDKQALSSSIEGLSAELRNDGHARVGQVDTTRPIDACSWLKWRKTQGGHHLTYE